MSTRGRFFFERIAGRLRAMVRQRISDSVADRPEESDLVSDLTHDAIASAAEHLDEFRGTTEVELIAWVCAIADCKVVDLRRYLLRQRRDTRRTQSLDPSNGTITDDADLPDAALLRIEQRAFVLGLIDRLPSVERKAIRLRYLEERPVAEVAAGLHRSSLAAQGVLKRALSRLRSQASQIPISPPEPPGDPSIPTAE